MNKLLNHFLIRKNLIFLLATIFLHALGLFCIIHGNNLLTLISLKQIGSGPLYIMNYHGGYRFKNYLENGASDLTELNKFIQKNIFHSSLITPDDGNSGCSAFSAYNLKNDAIYCRNLDIPGEHPAVLMYSSPPGGYASVSLVELTVLGYPDKEEAIKEKLSTLKGRKALLAAPFMPRDGINEHGLVVATLNMPSQKPARDPNKINVGRWQALRLMLDYSKNVNEAVSLLKKYNCFDGEVHFFIADSSGNSAIIEHVDGETVVIPKAETFQILTNFIVAHPVQPGGGHDRYNKIYNALNTHQGVLSEEEAMGVLESASQPNTAWSVIYNQHSGEIHIAMGRRFKEVLKIRYKKPFFK